MIRVMLVDDEKIVINGMKKLFDWESMGFAIVGEANDYEAAIDKYNECKPDLIITDICLPDKDGLDLLESVKAISRDTYVIILTGYSEFEFAKRAVDSDAFAYVLKPLDSFELKKYLLKVKKEFDAKRKVKEENLLRELLQNSPKDTSELNDLFLKYGVKIQNKNFFVLSIQVDKNEKHDNLNLYEALLPALKESLYEEFESFVLQFETKYISVIFYCDNDIMKMSIYKYMMQLKDEFEKQSLCTLTIGVSGIFSDFMSAQEAYLQSLYAVSQKAVNGYGSFNIWEDKFNGFKDYLLNYAVFISASDVVNVLNALENRNSDVACGIINEYFKNLSEQRRINIEMVRSNVIDLLIQIIRTFIPDSSAMERMFGHKINPINDINNMDLFSDIQKYLLNVINVVASRHEAIQADQCSALVKKVRLYVTGNYQIPIRISEMANNLHVDKTHLMKTFKKETGVSINQYITDYKVMMAKDLIKNGNYQIKEISYCVGYYDSKYFSKVFKKTTGYSPLEYREKYKS